LRPLDASAVLDGDRREGTTGFGSVETAVHFLMAGAVAAHQQLQNGDEVEAVPRSPTVRPMMGKHT
jgi:hypothetical protein